MPIPIVQAEHSKGVSRAPTVPAETAHVPQLLRVNNRRFNARTIRVHLERLREKGFVWWGRFYGGEERFSEAKARERCPHVAELADAWAASGESSLLFVSNFVDLHVLKVTRILLGDKPGGGVREDTLEYYDAAEYAASGRGYEDVLRGRAIDDDCEVAEVAGRLPRASASQVVPTDDGCGDKR